MIFKEDVAGIMTIFEDEFKIFNTKNTAGITGHLNINYDPGVIVIHAHHDVESVTGGRKPKLTSAPLYGTTDLESLVTQRFADIEKKLALRHTVTWLNAKDGKVGKWATVGIVVEGTEVPSKAGCVRLLKADEDFTCSYAHLGIWTLYNSNQSAKGTGWKIKHIISGLPVEEKPKRFRIAARTGLKQREQMSKQSEKDLNNEHMRRAYKNRSGNNAKQSDLDKIKVANKTKKFEPVDGSHIPNAGVKIYNSGPDYTDSQGKSRRGFRGWDVVVDRSR